MLKNLREYSNDNWGLCEPTLQTILNILKNNQINNILEFGSGKSTEFLIDARNELGLNFRIDSLDNSYVYCYKGEPKDYLNLIIRDLIVCDDVDYKEMFEKKYFDITKFKKVDWDFDATIKNATYNLNLNDLSGPYDLVIVDGPNGNGRNFSNFIMKEKIKQGTFVLFDDYFHYDFLNKFSEFFEYNLLEEVIFPQYTNKGHALTIVKKIK